MKQKWVAYAEFEKTILELYDLDLLILDRLDQVAHQYRWLGIDSAGNPCLLTHDGKDLYQVCIELVDPAFPVVARGSREDNEEYWEKEIKKWEDIVRWHWGWQAYNVAIPDQQPEKVA